MTLGRFRARPEHRRSFACDVMLGGPVRITGVPLLHEDGRTLRYNRRERCSSLCVGLYAMAHGQGRVWFA
jgi:hypothetical protein